MGRTFAGLVVLMSLVWVLPVSAQNCRKTFANRQNTRQDFVISTTAVTVLTANTSRCGAIISNISTNDMRCADMVNDGPPTATTGFLVKSGQWWLLELEGQGTYACIRSSTATADAGASVVESLP